MARPRALEGTWEELSALVKDKHNQRFRLIPLPNQSQAPPSAVRRPIRKGMFPQLAGLTDADFAAAEWRSDEAEF
jgi:hypothetical protein